MQPSIPASAFVSVNPSVLTAAGNPLAMIGLILSESDALPSGAPLSFASAELVSLYFGPTSLEAQMAEIYFAGYNTSLAKPSALMYVRYPALATAAFLRGGPVTDLAKVNAVAPASATGSIATTVFTAASGLTGTFVPGQVLTGSGVSAGTRIVQQLSGVTGGLGTYRVSISQTVASTAITGSYDLSVDIDGTPAAAASLDLSGDVSFSAAAVTIASALGLSGGQTCTYDSTFKAFVITSGTTGATSTIAFPVGAAAASALGLPQASGAVLSQGQDAITLPGAFMDNVVDTTTNWATFSSAFEPDITDKEAFSTWTSLQNVRYIYVPWDTDITATENPNTFTGFGKWLLDNPNISGTCLVYDDPLFAAFVMGYVGSLDFGQTNGAATLAYRSSDGLSATVDSLQVASNLVANGYNYYGRVATANQNFVYAYPGTISGPFAYIDDFSFAIWLNTSLQLANLLLLTQVGKIPYNKTGYAMVKSAGQGPIQDGLNFGGIQPGVVLSPSQIAAVNNAAGANIANEIAQNGWYYKVGPGTPTERVDRTSPPCTLWYTTGGSIQKLNINSVNIR